MADVSSPGLVLAGYVDRFAGHRLQVFGETEIMYLSPRDPAERTRTSCGSSSRIAVPCVMSRKD